jgi:hypothetical protein
MRSDATVEYQQTKAYLAPATSEIVVDFVEVNDLQALEAFRD